MFIWIYRILQCTWGIVQTLLGFVVFLCHFKDRHFVYNGAIATEWKRNFGLSLGLFIFVWPNDSHVLVHEYGHTLQSMVLGPLYLILVGIPSALWANLPFLQKRRMEQHISYYRFYPEKSANQLGEKVTKEKSMR